MSPAPSKSVVLVDDEKSYLDLMTALLGEHLDCVVHGFARPLDALAALPRLDPAVVVTDYFMPEINGIEFIRRARPLVPRAAFLVISGHDVPALEEDLHRIAVIKGFLAKPFSWRTLTEEIRRVWPREATLPSTRADATSL